MPSTQSTPMLMSCGDGASAAAPRRSIAGAGAARCPLGRPLTGPALAGRALAGRTPHGLARLFGRLQHAAAAALGAAAARVDHIDVGRIVAVALYLIVVG